MKVWTHSDTAVDAQKGVMEFLLINHPLDCPICDQGGECQLQDLAVGYGASNSRYLEPKRVVLNKNLGPLISTDMTRCIHCTRCVRFGQEIAGVMELGMIGRGEHAEIITFVGKTVDSELSGNVIDLCPVGALTSKPFRYTARTWELARRKSVSPHDSLGSNLIVQVKGERVMRIVPLENEAINECWLSDKDRFSYEGVNSDDRLTRPMVKRDGKWSETTWQVALEHVAAELGRIRDRHGAAAIGALVSPHSTLEEMHLAQKLVRGLGSDNVDFRLRQSDFSTDGKRDGATWLGMPIAEIAALDRVLVAGSFLRKDHPLLAHRLRQRAKKDAEISLVHAADDELLIRLAHKAIVAPSALPRALAEIAVAAAAAAGKDAPSALAGIEPSDVARDIAASLAGGERRAVLLGSFAEWHPAASQLHALAQSIAESTGATLGFLGDAANSIGGTIAGAFPRQGGLNAAAMLAEPRKAYVILNADPELDTADPAATRAALAAAELVVAMSPFKSGALEHADVLLPVAPFTETGGTFVNCEGRAQAFSGVVMPLAETRPAWKVLRVLGSLLGLPGFGYESLEAVRAELPRADELGNWLSNATGVAIEAPGKPKNGSALERVADVPIYFADPLVRRARSLQKTRDASPPRLRAHPATLAQLRLSEGKEARVRQGAAHAKLEVVADAGTPEGCLRVPAGHHLTSALGPMFGPLEIEGL
jgi:NADH-quinone oxidoreductase subunit G